MKKLKNLRIISVIIAIIIVIALLYTKNLFAIGNSTFNKHGSPIAIVAEIETPSLYRGNASPNTYSGRSSISSLVSLEEQVVVIGQYIPELHSTATFGTVDSNGDFVLIFGGAHSGYENILKEFTKNDWNIIETEFGWILDVSNRGYSAESFTNRCAVKAPNAGYATILFNGEVVALNINYGVDNFIAHTEAGTQVSAGFSGAPIMQDGNLVGVVYSGKSEGASRFSGISATVYTAH